MVQEGDIDFHDDSGSANLIPFGWQELSWLLGELLYLRTDTIGPERLKQHVSALDKFSLAFQRLAWWSDDIREWGQLLADEQRVKATKRHPVSNVNVWTGEDPIDIGGGLVIFHDSLRLPDLADEIENLFGENVNFARWYGVLASSHWKGKGSKEDDILMNIGYHIRYKLLVIAKYFRWEVHIKTTKWKEVFRGTAEQITKSIDGMLYYKDHQEKYVDPDWDIDILKFDDDHENDPSTTLVPLVNIKITDLSYGALEEVFALLREEGIAPNTYMFLSSNLLAGLQEERNALQ